MLATLFVLSVGLTSLTQASPDSLSIPRATIAGCPAPISVKNGGFESGMIPPWKRVPTPSKKGIKQAISSPGYKSNYALRVKFPEFVVDDNPSAYYTLGQVTSGPECYGYYYNISYAYNWAAYVGPTAKAYESDSYCRFYVTTTDTDPQDVYHYGKRVPGWHTNWYVARAVQTGQCKANSTFLAHLECDGTLFTAIPGFLFLMDDLKIEPLDMDPTNPPPPFGTCT